MLKKSLAVASTLTMVLIAPGASGQNMDFLALDPLRFFTEEDYKLAEQTAIDALDNNADGAGSDWENPESGNSGTITPLATIKNKQGETCRKVKILDRTPGLSGEDTLYVCKGSDTRWRFVQHSRAPVR